ncbi:predicted protein [Verticillium alfalfae VaMs.102]|uniref:Predicted protein n=1 Tax=Verticillium alfalfae (strain VaMs.102 / ATCC MYA-4576 / FGSC 10136) TaxID=526221 RepID=C9SD71_VERA1|nr:predicted protein [Verticillium alfalfae VaMs.102]EEY17036.1 predicted protein [Verticillium alfalfae VaMs.102]
MTTDLPPTATRARSLPYLPPEIWMHIIGCITDSRYIPRVWLNLRLVSRFFQTVTERVFANCHPPTQPPRVSGLLTPSLTNTASRATSTLPSTLIVFSDDGLRASTPTRPWPAQHGTSRLIASDATVHDECVKQWREKVTAYLAPPPANRYDVAPHILVLRRIANDTELPNLRVDYDRFEASFDWRPALSKLFGEEEYRKWAGKQHPDREWRDIIKSVDSGRMSRIALSRAVMYRLYDPKKVDSKVRQTRIKRYYRAHGREMQPGSFGDVDYLGKTREVFAVRQDLRRAFISDEWMMGDGEEESRGTFYDDGAGVEFPQSDPEDEPDEDVSAWRCR